MLAINETRSVFSHQAVPAPKQLRTGGTHWEEARGPLITQHSSAAPKLPFPQKGELKPAREQQIQHQPLSPSPQAMPCTSSSSPQPAPYTGRLPG